LSDCWTKVCNWQPSKQAESIANLHSINYDVDYLLVDKSSEFVEELLRLLSQTDQMSYFRSKFLQRMINYYWFNFYRKSYMKVLKIHILIFLLILLSVTLINHESRSACHARIGINCVNIIPMAGVMFFFEWKKTKERFSWVTFLYCLSFVFAIILDAASCQVKQYEPIDDDATDSTLADID